MRRRRFLVLSGAAALPLLLSSPVRAASSQVKISRDVIYTTTPITLRCDIYRPSKGGPFPVVIMVVDGLWQMNGYAGTATLATSLARDYGLAAIALQLRTAPTWQAPAPMEDCARLLDFVTFQAALYNLDPSRVAALGGSGGGHVASFLSLGTYLSAAQFARIRCTVPVSPPTDLRKMDDDGTQGDFTSTIESFLGVTEAQSPATWEAFSPALRVTPTTKPMLVLYSQNDAVPPMQGQRLADALTVSGVEQRLSIYPGSLHGWALIQDPVAWAEIASWLRSHLG